MEIIVNYNQLKSIEKAERQKASAERKGYYLVLTEKIGVNTFKLYYKLIINK